MQENLDKCSYVQNLGLCSSVFLLKMNIDLDVFLGFNFVFSILNLLKT